MIVLSSPPGLVLVRQPDHAALSACLAEAWRRPESMPPAIWQRLITAVRHHDDGWLEAEERPALDATGRPYDFKELPAADTAPSCCRNRCR